MLINLMLSLCELVILLLFGDINSSFKAVQNFLRTPEMLQL